MQFRVILLTTLVAAPSFAQCPQWSGGFHRPGVESVFASVVHDDGFGAGPLLYAGGRILGLGPASDRLARLTDGGFENVGGELDGDVLALAVFDSGSGPELVVGGRFTHTNGAPNSGLALWNSVQWKSVGAGAPPRVGELAVFDDGTGAQLYACSPHESPQGPSARWDGSTWTNVVFPPAFIPQELRVLDLGAGPRLIVGGWLTTGVLRGAVYELAAHGGAWTQVGPGVTNFVRTLTLFDDGGGAKLHVGTDAGSDRVVVWRLDAGSWTPLLQLTGTGFGVHALASFTDASGPRLYAGGNLPFYSTLLQQHHVLAWDGNAWSTLGVGQYNGVDGIVETLTVFDPPGATPESLAVGGQFDRIGERASSGIGLWRDGTWTPSEAGHGVSGIVRKLCVLPGASGSELIAGGDFRTAGTSVAEHVAAWNGISWRSLQGPGGPVSAPQALGVAAAGGVPKLYAGIPGAPWRVARWDDGVWTQIGPALSDAVVSLVPFDFGGGEELVAAGYFTNLVSGSPRIARWNGASWQALASGLPQPVRCAFVWQGELYASQPGSIQRWTGTSWSTFASVVGEVRAATQLDDGSGHALYVAGTLWEVAGVPLDRVARWDGSAWSAVGAPGFDNYLESAQGFDAGNGPALYVGGPFTRVGGLPSGGLARWDGTSWSPVDGGIVNDGFPDRGVLALAIHDDGDGAALFAGGGFKFAGSLRVGNLARLACDAANGEPYCAGDALDAFVTSACPCSNYGAPGHGCANSASALGARLDASGSKFVDPVSGTDTVVLVCSDMSATATTIFLCGDASTDAGLVFGDGVRCVDGGLIRLGIRTAVGGVASYPSPGGLSLSQRSQMPPGSGLTGHYQTYYRNASASFCPPATFNVSSGRRIVW